MLLFIVPLKKPEIVSIVPGCNNVTLSWSQDKSPINIKEFLITLYQGSTTTVIGEKLLTADKTTCQFNLLQENSVYRVRVKQQTGISGTGYSTEETFETATCMYY